MIYKGPLGSHLSRSQVTLPFPGLKNSSATFISTDSLESSFFIMDGRLKTFEHF